MSGIVYVDLYSAFNRLTIDRRYVRVEAEPEDNVKRLLELQ